LDSISLSDRFVDLEFDSLRFIQLVVQLEYVLSIEFEDEKLNPALFERVGDLLAYLETLAPEAPTDSIR
jgi:acyl carrier protein